MRGTRRKGLIVGRRPVAGESAGEIPGEPVPVERTAARGRFAGAVLYGWVLSVSLGCGTSQDAADRPELTPTAVRAQRRAFAGAPPVIPHPPLGASCVVCHTPTGKPVPKLGMAPANPHARETAGGHVENCRQCHVFQVTEDQFRESTFDGPRRVGFQGERSHPLAPPAIPHRTILHENCLGCHAGPAARPELRCSHPERRNCRQCHLESHPVAPEAFGQPFSPAQTTQGGTGQGDASRTTRKPT